MRLRIREPEDFVSGILFAVLGLGALWIAFSYPMGTATRMGPGYMPAVLGGLLAFLGVVIMLKSLDFGASGDSAPDFQIGQDLLRLLRPLVFVVTGLLTFAYVLPRYGLVAAVILLVTISAFADYKPRLMTAVPLAVLLAGVTVLIFVRGLGLPIRVWP